MKALCLAILATLLIATPIAVQAGAGGGFVGMFVGSRRAEPAECKAAVYTAKTATGGTTLVTVPARWACTIEPQLGDSNGSGVTDAASPGQGTAGSVGGTR